MALLTLKDIGKIYVSEGNVAVGIRGVNLSFDRGEFVAVTGKSGSGKSTLLNVISGMDTYEEGEMYIEGEVTSHYMQPDWEEYRKKYISFIFQDYNIIESFTVLENVELALMHIADKKERKRRALALLERVGLKDRINQKGSKLSGGQKQRTVIARALAKDSPIILADEPTGNLDSKTSEEIIELLREVSKDKLLIVVTHNFEQVEKYATRHVRIFDGAVESDHVIVPPEKGVGDGADVREAAAPTGARNRAFAADMKNGATLGWAIFKAKPKLTVFLSMLLIVGMLAIFFVTSIFAEGFSDATSRSMFTYHEGRVVATTRSGETVTEEQIAALAKEYGAEDHLRYDYLLDEGRFYVYVAEGGTHAVGPSDFYFHSGMQYTSADFECTVGEDFGKNIIGRYPSADNEVLLYMPVSYKPYFGSSEIVVKKIDINDLTYDVTGIKYFYDNNLPAKALFTQDGLRVATAAAFVGNWFNANGTLSVVRDNESVYTSELYSVYPSFEVEADKLYLEDDAYRYYLREGDTSTLNLSITYRKSMNYYDTQTYAASRTFGDADMAQTGPSSAEPVKEGCVSIYVGTALLKELAEDILADAYRQFSLFYGNDAEAHAAVEKLGEAGYIAIPTDTRYEAEWYEVLLQVLVNLYSLALWLVSIVFLAMFVNLCSRRALDAFKGDMAIMRSMGISVRVIKAGMYVRMIITLVPAFVMLAAVACTVFLTPVLNGMFPYLYAWHYALISLGMILLTLRVTHRQIRKLFKESVKKSLKGGASV